MAFFCLKPCLKLGIWSLEFGVSAPLLSRLLKLGIWNFSGVWSLEFGVLAPLLSRLLKLRIWNFPGVWSLKFGVLPAFALGLLLLLSPSHSFAAFGVTSAGGSYTVDTGAGLVFKVNQTSGDITS